MPSQRTSLLIAAILIAGLPALSQAADGTVQFRVLIDRELLASASPPSDQTEAGDLVPCPIAFIYLDRPGRPPKSLPPPLAKWFASLPKPAEPKQQRVTIQDGQFAPQLLTLRSGDGIVPGDIRETLRFHRFNNPALGVLCVKGTEYRFDRPEPAPVKMFIGEDPRCVGYLLVTDHPYAAVSKDAGLVRFRNIPTKLEIPWQIACPLIARDRFEYTSPDVKIERNGRFAIRIPESGEFACEIHIVKKPAEKK